jgi:hypothetical protein
MIHKPLKHLVQSYHREMIPSYYYGHSLLFEVM